MKREKEAMTWTNFGCTRKSTSFCDTKVQKQKAELRPPPSSPSYGSRDIHFKTLLRNAGHTEGLASKKENELCKLQQLKLMRGKGIKKESALSFEHNHLSFQCKQGLVRTGGQQVFQMGIIFLVTESKQNKTRGKESRRGSR